MKIYQELEPTEEEKTAMEEANAILAKAGLELIGTRPKDRA